MIFTQTRFFIKTAKAYSPSDEEVRDLIKDKKYHRILIYSYKKIDFNEKFIFVSERFTPLIEVGKKDKEEILQGFRESYRTQIRKTYKIDSLRFEVKSANATDVYSQYVVFEKTQGRPPLSKFDFKNYIAFCAYDDGDLISVLICLPVDKTVLKVITLFSKRLEVSDKSKYQRIGYSSRRLVYEACVYATEKDMPIVDLAYVDLSNEEKMGINDFKMGFGGVVTSEYAYEYKSNLISLFRIIKSRLGV